MVFEKFAFKNNLKNTSLEPFSNRTLDYFLCRGISEYRVEHPKFVILKDAFHLETKRRNTWKTKITSRLSKMKVIMLELLKALKVFDIYIYIYIYIYICFGWPLNLLEETVVLRKYWLTIPCW